MFSVWYEKNHFFKVFSKHSISDSRILNKGLELILVLFLLLFSFWAGKSIFKYNLFSTHDLNHHLSRSFDAVETIKEGHFPLRWAGSLNYKCGVPIFNFFYPLVYYLIVFFYFVTQRVIFSWKLLNFLSVVFGTLFFYLWIKKEVKDVIASFAGAFLYLYAPYRFSLIFVRGSPEFLAYAIFPLVLYFFSSLFVLSGKKFLIWGILASLSGALLVLSHNFTAMFLMPILLMVILSKHVLIKFKKSKFLFILFSFVSSFGLSSFFVGPALIEKSYVRLGGVDSVIDYREHFPTLGQLLRSKWDYFYSVPGTGDGMSFMLGYAQWVILLISFFTILYFLYSEKKKLRLFLRGHFWLVFYFAFSVLTIFLILPYSIFVWERIKLLQQVQFPWRLLGVAVFLVSALFSFLLLELRKSKLFWPFLVFVIFLAFWGNRNHLLPQPLSSEDSYLYSDYNRLHYHRYSTTTLGDDILSVNAKVACNFSTPMISSGDDNLEYNLVSRKNTSGAVRMSFKENLSEFSRIIFALEYFPGAYEFSVDGREGVSYNDCEGRVCIDAKEFTPYSFVSWHIVQTPIQKFFNMVSLSVFLFWIFLLLGLHKKRVFWVSLIVIGLFLFLRTHNLDKKILFGWDQERDAFAVSEILKGKLTLIGPRVVGSYGFFLPPYFFYILSPFYFVSGGNPQISLLLFLFSYWILFFILSFKFLGKSLGENESLLFLLIWSVLPLAVGIDRIVWNPVFIPLFFVILLFFHHRYYSTRNLFWFFALSIFYFFGASFHIQGLFYFPFVLSAFLFDGKKVFLKKLILFVLSALLVFFPIILFDLRHNFLNFSLVFNFGQNSLVRGGFFDVWSNFVSKIVGLKVGKVGSFVFYLVFLILNLFLLARIKLGYKKHLLYSLFLILFSFPVVFLIYGFRPSEYYFNFLIPVFVLIVSLAPFLASSRFNKLFMFLVLTTFVVWSIFLNLKNADYYDGESLYFKEKAIGFIKEITENRNYNLSLDSKNGKDTGFYYLLRFYNLEYNRNNTFSLIRIVEPPDNNCPMHFGTYSVCFLPEDFGW